MSIQDYLNQKKEYYKHLLDFIDGLNVSFQNLKTLLENYIENPSEFQSFLHLLLTISQNHHRNPDFYLRIKQILLSVKDKIKHSFTNAEIFDFFKNDKQILLFLLEEKILVQDENINKYLLAKWLRNNTHLRHFFITELQSTVNQKVVEEEEDYDDDFDGFYDYEDDDLLKISEEQSINYDEKRHIGENDTKICELIRKDSIEEFTSFVTENKVQISSEINHSIFETNPLLIDNKPTLIQYAAFFGSKRIFIYLLENGAKYDQSKSIWIYAIHGRNLELIRFLEEKKIEPEDKSFEKCLEESIKCHHNEIVDYIQNNLLDKKIDSSNLENDFDCNSIQYAFQYQNYQLITIESLNSKFAFYYACQFGYLKIVEYFLNSKKVNINEPIIKLSLFLI